MRHPRGNDEPPRLAHRYHEIPCALRETDPHEAQTRYDGDFGAALMNVVPANPARLRQNHMGIALRRKLDGRYWFKNTTARIRVESDPLKAELSRR